MKSLLAVLASIGAAGASALRSPRANAKYLVALFLGALTIALVVAIDDLGQESVGLAAQTFLSPIQTPTPESSPTPSAACPSQIRWHAFEADVEVEGLPGVERAMVRLKLVNQNITECLGKRGMTLPEVAFGNGRHHIQLQEIPDGAYYKLEIESPPSFLRSPAGYLFQVQEGQILRRPGYIFRFQLVPPAKQDLPPCREFEKQFIPSIADIPPTVGDIPADTQKDVCQAEGTIDLSAPPKQPEGSRGRSISSTGYHYIGPVTDQDSQGVWGRNTVVDPSVPHVIQPPNERFVAERVYAQGPGSNPWMEAGWAEVSWRNDKQYVYLMWQSDSVNYSWIFFDEYLLSPGTTVETDVQYDATLGKWKALYYLGGNSWRVLGTADLGFTIANRAFNRGEVYTADGVHPILPLSGFDKGYLLIDGVWRNWDTRYPTDITEKEPYHADMITEYYRFNIHSPIVFIPFVLK